MQLNFDRYRIHENDCRDDSIRHSMVHRIDYEVAFHCHAFYEIFLILTGGIYHEVNGEIQEVRSNSILFIRPDDVHRYRQLDEENCSLVRLWVSLPVFETMKGFLGNTCGLELMEKEKLPVSITVSKLEMQNFANRFEALFALPPEEDEQRMASLKLLLLELILLLSGFARNKSYPALPTWLEDICRQMAERDNFLNGIERLFELSPKTREHVSRSFKRYLEITPTEYINRLRLNYAANQLANTNKKIVDICYDSGFGNLSHFYQCFEGVYGFTPKDYRKLNTLQAELT